MSKKGPETHDLRILVVCMSAETPGTAFIIDPYQLKNHCYATEGIFKNIEISEI